MFELNKIVIPRIMNEWQYLAKALCFDVPIIMAIKEKERGDPKSCCREFFREWLSTYQGAKAGQKIWSTLLDALKKVDEIPDSITQEIIEKVMQL